VAKVPRRRWVALLIAIMIFAVMATIALETAPTVEQAGRLAGLGLVVAVLSGVIARCLISLKKVATLTAELVRREPDAYGRPYLPPGELPPPPAIFEGRTADVAEVADRLLRAGRRRTWRPYVVVIHGDAGVGKSGFAVKVASTVVNDFPGGVVYASFTDVEPDSDQRFRIIGDLVDALQGPNEVVPGDLSGRLKEWRKQTRSKRGRRALYVLDDVSRVEVLDGILPARGVVLVTSRTALDGLHRDHVRELQPLSEADAERLLQSLLDETVPTQGPIRTAFDKVLLSASGYPFALHLAARAISGRGLWALPDITADLSDTRPGDPQEARARMLDLTYAVLRPEHQRALLSLALLKTQTFYPWMVAAMAGLPEDEAGRTCEVLADHRLVERVAADVSGVVQLRILEGVRAYIDAKAPQVSTMDFAAAARALAVRQEKQGRKSLDEDLAKAAGLLRQGQLGEAVTQARAALAEARRRRDQPGGPAGSPGYHERYALAVLAEAMSELGGLDDARDIIVASQPDAPVDRAGAHLWRTLGQLRRREWKHRDSVAVLRAAAAVAGRVGDRAEQIACLREAAIAHSTAREFAEAELALVEAFQLLRPDDDSLRCRLVEARALDRLNQVRSQRGLADAVIDERLTTAAAELTEALDRMPAADKLWRAWARYHLALLYLYLAVRDGTDLRATPSAYEYLVQGRHHVQTALEAFSTMSHKYGVARCRLELGRAERADGNHRLARAQLEEARETLLLCGDRWLEAQTAFHLAELRMHTDHGPNRAEALRYAEAEAEFALHVFEATADENHAAPARTLLEQIKEENGAAQSLATTPGRTA
jgi:hypothetical protein